MRKDPAANGPTLLETKWGVYEGTWLLPVPYESSIWDRLFAKSIRKDGRGSSRITLTKSCVIIDRWVGGVTEIPLKRVIGVHTCATVGTRYWGKNRMVKIVWAKDGDILCSAIMVGPGKKKATDWKEAIEELSKDNEQVKTATNDEVQEAIARVRQDNRRITVAALTIFPLSALLLFAVLMAARSGHHYASLSLFGSSLFLLAGAYLLVKRFYNQRFIRLGRLPGQGMAFSARVLLAFAAISLLVIVTVALVFLLVWLVQ